MEINEISENKDNFIKNDEKAYFFKKVKIPINFFNINNASNNNELNNKILMKSSEKFDQINYDIYNNINKNNNNNKDYDYTNNISHNILSEEDLDIELNSVSKIIPINSFVNMDEISSIQKKKKGNENEIDNKKKKEIFKKLEKIKRTSSANSFFDDIKKDDQFNININHNTTNIYDNCPQYSEFNMTNFGLSNRPNIYSNYQNEKEDMFNKTNNNIYNKNNNNKSTYNKKEDCRVRRHNSAITPNINQFLDINNENILNNTNNIFNYNPNQNLIDEIQKLKKENKKLFLKNNELSLKLKKKEIKSKTNNNYNNINQKKLTSHKEEFLLQKIKKLESEIIKQKDLITKLSYHKRFNIGIRKIRVNSILIKGNNNKIKRKNSLSNLYCNNYMHKKINSNQNKSQNQSQNQNINLNNTLPNKLNKFIKKKSQYLQNNKYNKEDTSIHIKPGDSSISSSPKNLIKDKSNKENKDNNNKNGIYNKNAIINLKLENLDNINNYRKKMKEKFKEKKVNKVDKNKNEEIKSNDEFNNTKVIDNNNYKKLGPHKTYGKTSLIMSVINDNLLGNFNLTQYMNAHTTNLNNKNMTKKISFKRNSIY